MRNVPVADPGRPDVRSPGPFLFWLGRRQAKLLTGGTLAGRFDDIVIRRHYGPDTFWRVKSSNYGHMVINTDSLTTAETRVVRGPPQRCSAPPSSSSPN